MPEQPDAAENKRSSENVRQTVEISLVRGGPFYRLQEAAGLVKDGQWNVGRRVLFGLAIGWFPLVLITLLFKTRTLPGLLTDYPINARMLVGVPVLLVGQTVMESAFRTIIGQIRAAALVTPSEAGHFDQILASLIRLRDSIIPEIVIIVGACLHAAEVVETHMALARPWALAGTSSAPHVSIAGWYYIGVSLLLYQFLLFISLWKWLLWWIFLLRLSRLDLELVPTHPDQHGGIGFLGLSPLAIAPTVFVACTAIGGTWRAEIYRTGVHMMSFKLDALVLLAVILIVSLGPLVFFVPKLGQLRRRGVLEYGVLAQFESLQFHSKWILNRNGHEDEFMASPEASTLTDYGSSYQNIEHLQPFPFDQGAFVALLLAIAIPILPVILTEIPFADVVKGLLSAVR
jgi:hypothetical protein